METVEKVEETSAENKVEETAATKAPSVEEAPIVEETPVAEVAEKPVAETKKKEEPKAPKKSKKVAINGIVKLNAPTAIYRGPGVYPFAKINGVVKPLEDADESGYTKVQCVISGSGSCIGYVKL